MPKMKTRKAVLSRFKVSSTGKLMRGKKGRRHILTKKTGKKKRHLRSEAVLDKSYAKKYARLMQVG